jgi:hypothetical protein
MTKHIEILQGVHGFEVRVVDANGRVLRRFTYATIEGARTAATAWTVAYDNCEVRDLTSSKAEPDIEKSRE